MRSITALALVLLVTLEACGGSRTTPAQILPLQDDTADVQAAVDRGGLVTFAAKTYHLSRTIVIRNSGTVIAGSGPNTVFEYQPPATQQHCVDDRVFTTPCAFDDPPPRRIATPISVGDLSFTATAAEDVADLKPGDWVIVNDFDSVIGDRVAVDWAQVATVSGVVVNVRQPFRMAFGTARPWVPGRSGLGFEPVPLVEGIELRDFKVLVDQKTSPNMAAVSIFGAMNVTIDNVAVENYNGQPLYCYLSKGVIIENSQGTGASVLSEFAASVDVTIRNNQFSSTAGAGFGLDMGTAFFAVGQNSVRQSANIGIYLLHGVHDGTLSYNLVGYVDSTVQGGSAVGMLIWGSQNVAIANNNLLGGAGPKSIGISVQGDMGQLPEPNIGNTLAGNSISGFVTAIQNGP
jgi:hypothetical protein